MISAIDQNTQISNNTEQTFKSIISSALAQNKQLTELELAKLSGFTDEECNMLSLYWQPCFNNSWIYLSDELILGYLTNEKGKDAITHFIKQVLKPSYQEGLEYQEVLSSHELIKFGSLKLASTNSKSKPAHNKKYYIVSAANLLVNTIYENI